MKVVFDWEGEGEGERKLVRPGYFLGQISSFRSQLPLFLPLRVLLDLSFSGRPLRS